MANKAHHITPQNPKCYPEQKLPTLTTIQTCFPFPNGNPNGNHRQFPHYSPMANLYPAYSVIAAMGSCTNVEMAPLYLPCPVELCFEVLYPHAYRTLPTSQTEPIVLMATGCFKPPTSIEAKKTGSCSRKFECARWEQLKANLAGSFEASSAVA